MQANLAVLLQVVPTPLTRLRWWRVALDEAQMVGSSTAQAAEMALKLHTEHRWWGAVATVACLFGARAPTGPVAYLPAFHVESLPAATQPASLAGPVEPAGRQMPQLLLMLTIAGHQCAPGRRCVTGTPLSRGLEDLFGLLAFLQAAPYDSRPWFQRVLQHPYEAGSRAARARLLALLKPSLGGLLWRSAKADVAEELGLPPQHHHLTNLHLSAIERHFYSRQHQVGCPALPAHLSALSSCGIRGEILCDPPSTLRLASAWWRSPAQPSLGWTLSPAGFPPPYLPPLRL